ncbi:MULTISPECIES: enoyl-CoA hydratase [unclassified Polynucleobacter]|uniref:enoyl-CoA hydratase n=1 Tax=unclassified Polynucleobacter TaxID=2640945 RepID=UPI0025747601|nr:MULTISPECIES: enoyl-CoA hydratase [unclassified Polynucleobacter]BEI41991.1 enoyl-CoA hydratase [Polynucleobacter sp. HIN10]BEI43768.1 enoyl-CoA hydratase [Polynucleobacter sp. HIN11]
MSYNTILTQTEGKVALITLNRPQVLNALNDELMDDLGDALLRFDADDAIACIVITGSEKAFAAGADISKMAQYDFQDTYRNNFITRNWETICKVRKPVIAAVSGFALGGGCELAMMCDMIIAADNAKFAQPEIKLGIIPGSGGTQRLTRAVSKSKAMDLCLTGRMMDAAEAERSGLVARVYPVAQLMSETMAIAQTIAAMPLLTLMMVKESVNAAYETTLTEGVRFERRLFHACFATEDQKEGMAAFLEKRPAQFKNR